MRTCVACVTCLKLKYHYSLLTTTTTTTATATAAAAAATATTTFIRQMNTDNNSVGIYFWQSIVDTRRVVVGAPI